MDNSILADMSYFYSSQHFIFQIAMVWGFVSLLIWIYKALFGGAVAAGPQAVLDPKSKVKSKIKAAREAEHEALNEAESFIDSV